MLKAAAVSIVLALTLGANAPVWCQVWCAPPPAAAGCHSGKAAGTGLRAADVCVDAFGSETALVSERVRRADTPHANLAAVFLPLHQQTLTSRALARGTLAAPPVRDARPLITDLRI